MGKIKCIHKSFWDIYKVINFNRTFSSKKGIDFKCSKCGKQCNLKWEGYNEMQKEPIKKYFIYFFWLLPAIILIVFMQTMIMLNYLSLKGIVISCLYGILLIVVYHFGAMYYVFKSKRLKISKKGLFNFG